VSGPLSYDVPGATVPASADWTDPPAGYRHWEASVVLGHGDAVWSSARASVLSWGIKTRSGFAVIGEPVVRAGADVTLVARIGPLRIKEPARVVAVVGTTDRAGFAYGTRPGHPVSGEEAFILHRHGDDVVLTVRSLTRAPRGRWRLAYPIALIAQRRYRRRYLAAG
jgi:uncharacterized protein (UPF0548 family)